MKYCLGRHTVGLLFISFGCVACGPDGSDGDDDDSAVDASTPHPIDAATRADATDAERTDAADAARADAADADAHEGPELETYTPVPPYRVVDTRHGVALAAGESRCWQVAGAGLDVPADAVAVTVNLTAVSPSSSGYLTLYPYDSSDSTVPGISALNYAASQTLANGVTVRLGDDGKVCVYSLRPSHVVLDATGYYGDPAAYTPTEPFRLVDTRAGDGGTLGNGASGCWAVTEAGVPASAKAVAINLAAVAPSASGHLIAYAKGASGWNDTSNLNYVGGRTQANGAIVEVGDSEQICVYTLKQTDVVIDVTGYFGGGSRYEPIEPERIVNTASALGAGSTTCWDVAGEGGVPSDAKAVAINVTAVAPSATGYVTLYASGTTKPSTSSLNYAAGETLANNGIVELGTDGKLCAYTLRQTKLNIDVSGSFDVVGDFTPAETVLQASGHFVDYNWKVPSVATAVQQISATPQTNLLPPIGGSIPAYVGCNHNQGIQRYQNKHIISSSVPTGNSFIGIVEPSGATTPVTLSTGINLNHAGGFQMLGDAMVVALSNLNSDACSGSSSTKKISFFDMRSPSSPVHLSQYDLVLSSGDSQAAGAVRVDDEIFVVVVTGRETLQFWSLTKGSTSWQLRLSWSTSSAGWSSNGGTVACTTSHDWCWPQNVNLVRQDNGDVYLLTFSHEGSSQERVGVYKLAISASGTLSLNKTTSSKFVTSGSGATMRSAGGALAMDNGEMQVFSFAATFCTSASSCWESIATWD